MKVTRFRIVYILALAAVLWGGEYARRDLWEPDEARYAYVAREMADEGNWSIPRRHGELYPDKPPLMFWLINAGSLLTGGEINRVSTRLPSLLGVVLSLWVAASLLARWAGPGAARRSIWILSTTFLFWYQGGMGQIDSLLCGLQMSALYLLFTAGDPGRGLRFLGAYAGMGLAVLAKGPVGFAVPLGVYIAATVAAGESGKLRKTHWWWGWLVTLLFPAAWLLWAYLDGAPGEYFRAVLFSQNIERAAGTLGHAGGDPLYFFWHFALESLPWSIFLPSAWLALGRSDDGRNLRRRLGAWLLFVIVFFTVIPSKRNLYILLAYPAGAMLTAAAWDRLRKWEIRVGIRALAGLLALIGIAAAAAIFVPELPIARCILWPCAAIAAVAVVFLLVVLRRTANPDRLIAAAAGAMFAIQLCVANLVYPALNDVKAPRAFAAAVRDKLGPNRQLLLYRVRGEILCLYAGARGKEVFSPRQIIKAATAARRGVVITPTSEADELRPLMKDRFVFHEFRMGHKQFSWLEFDLDG